MDSRYRWYKGAYVCYAYLSDCCIPSKPAWESMLKHNAVVNNIPELSTSYWELPSNLGRSTFDVCICVGPEKNQKQPQHDSMYDLLRHCRWFTRGWTLQELIAPQELAFYDCQWQMVSKRCEILNTLEAITGIHKEALELHSFCRNPESGLSQFSVAKRMHWHHHVVQLVLKIKRTAFWGYSGSICLYSTEKARGRSRDYRRRL